MKPFRKTIGFLIIALIGIPVLFATIIAVGITNSVVSPEVMSDLPEEIISELPSSIDEIYETLKNENDIKDEKTKTIVEAMKSVNIRPSRILDDSGILKWLQGELSVSLKQFGEVLRGERKPDPIRLNMAPLKKALLHNSITSYLRSVITNLPECRDLETEEWKKIAFTNDISEGFDLDGFPSCRPTGLEITDDLIKVFQLRAVEKIPEDTEIFDDYVDFPQGWNFTRIISAAMYAFFILPALLIFLGSLIASTSKESFFRWSGVATMIGGITAYGLGSLMENIIPISKFATKYDFSNAVSSRFEELIILKTGEITEMFMDSLFAPTTKLAGTVIIIGLIIFAISFLVNDGKDSTYLKN